MIIARAHFGLWLAGACAMLVLLVVASLAIGHYPASAPGIDAVILQLRAPRVAAAMIVGAALAAAGASYQGLFRNPLVSPDILGVSSGCALGAAIAVLLSLPMAAIQAFAFAGGMAAVALVVAVASLVRGRDTVLTLLLSGVVIGSAFGAAIAMAKSLADPYNQLPSITFWLLGSFTSVLPRDLLPTLVPIVIGLVPLVLLRWRVDVLALSDDEAHALGLRVGALRLAIIACATLVTACAISLAGTIGWVGLVIPHAARLLAGAAFARVLPLAIVLGAGFMLAVDTLCRSAFATELPPGVVTAMVGTPAFVALMAASFRRRA
jgi:iron complex transport system permease protein